MAIENGIKYVCTQLPQSTDWFRLVNGTVNTLHDYGIDTLFGATLGPIGDLAKGLEGAYYGKKAIENFNALVFSVQNYNSKSDKQSLLAVFNEAVKCTGDTLTAFKWLGTIGSIVVLAPYAKSFGYVKNVCSVYLASIKVFQSGTTIWTKFYSNDADKNKAIALATAEVICSLCSIWLNGMGGLSSYVGTEAFLEKGMQRLPPWTFNVAVLTSSITSIAKNIATAPAA